MVRILCNKKSFYLNKELKLSLDIQIHDMKIKNQDLVIVIDGKEGSGKSTFGRQIAYYCSKELGTKFTVDNIHFDLQEYINTSLHSEQYTINLLDEGRKLLNKKRSNSRETVTFTNYLSECRDKQQVHIILLPAFHDLDTYVVLWRMDFLIHLDKYHVEDEKVSTGWRLVLGNYKVFDNNNALKKFYNFKYSYPKNYDVWDKFPNFEVLKDIEVYNEKKLSYTIKKYTAEMVENTEDQERINRAERIKKSRSLGVKMITITEIEGIHERTGYKELRWLETIE